MAASRKTAGMRNFERQLDAAFPDRARPDGWIGDQAHRGRTSSHNPDDTRGSRPEWNGDPDRVPEVRAVDVAKNLGPGVAMATIVDHLRALPKLGTVVRYLIFDGKIYHERNDFRPADFDGDPHRDHLHVTFAFTQAADDNTSFDYRFEEIPVALTDADKAFIRQTVTEAVGRVLDDTVEVNGQPWKARTAIGYTARKVYEIQRDAATPTA